MTVSSNTKLSVSRNSFTSSKGHLKKSYTRANLSQKVTVQFATTIQTGCLNLAAEQHAGKMQHMQFLTFNSKTPLTMALTSGQELPKFAPSQLCI